MDISAVSAATANASRSSNLSMQDFLKVLLTQLTHQDPLKPMDNEQFMAQVAQFTTLEQTQEMNANMARLLANQAALQSVGLLNRYVMFTDKSGNPSQGTVTELSLEGQTPTLTVEISPGNSVTGVDLSTITTVR